MKECPKTIVEIKNLIKTYRRGTQTVPVLEDITFDICEEEFLALMGPSGSGKSTLLNIIAGIDKPDSGTVTVGGIDISSLSEGELARWRAVNVGFIFQFFALIPTLSAYENIEMPLLIQSVNRGRASAQPSSVITPALTAYAAAAPLIKRESLGWTTLDVIYEVGSNYIRSCLP